MYTSKKRSRAQAGHKYTGQKGQSVRRDGVLQNRVLNPDRYSAPGSALEYPKALVSPLDYASGDARIPDFISVPTQTSTIQLETTVSANGLGLAGGLLYMTSLGPRFFVESSTSTNSVFNYVSTSCGGSELPWAGDAVLGNTLIRGAYTDNQIFAGYRIVAAGMLVEFIGNDQNNQGSITCAALSSVDIANLGINNGAGTTTPWITSNTALENFRHNYTGAAKNGCYLRYFPIDPKDLDFCVCSNDPDAGDIQLIFSQRETASVNVPSGAGQPGIKQWGGLQWHGNGLSTTASFRVSIRIHLEGFVRFESLSIDTGITCIDTACMAICTEVLGGISDPRPATDKTSMVKESGTVAETIKKLLSTASPGVKHQLSQWLNNFVKSGIAAAGTLATAYMTSYANTGQTTNYRGPPGGM